MIPLELMPPLMFGGLVLFMLLGYPVAFSLAALGFFFGFISIHEGFFSFDYLQAIPGRVFGSVLSNDLLLAIPFFTFMGSVLERCGLAEDMLDSMGQLFGPIRGGLGYSVIIVGFILGAITGTVAAQVIAMALISMPVMIRYGYNMRYTTGVLAASGTITQLVPPSLVLIVLADQLGKSVGDMYLGAWGPSVFQILLFALYTFALSVFKPEWVPAVPRDALTLTGWALWKKCLLGIIPSAVLIFVVLGTMMLGLATPTEAGAMGAIGAIILAVTHHKEFSPRGQQIFLIGLVACSFGILFGVTDWDKALTPLAVIVGEHPLFRISFAIVYFAIAWICLEAVRIADLRGLIKQGYETTMRITAMVTFILIGSQCFSVVFLGVDGNRWLEQMLSSLPGGPWGFLVFINIFIFFLAFFLDFFEIAFIILPMIRPVAQTMLTPIVGADSALIWFGVMLCVNMQTSFMHPPFGFALFYLRGVAPKEVKTSDIYWGALPWVGLQAIMVALVIAFPITVTILLSAPSTIDPSKINIEIPDMDYSQPEPIRIK
jgi:TRAP-type mannitol/chloroaromatic compound transport system permease large subunit